MARFGLQPGDRGKLESQWTSQGLIQGFFIPKERPAPGTSAADRAAAGVKLIEADPANRQLTLYPTDTRPRSEDFLGPKYAKISAIVLPFEGQSDLDVREILEELPSGFTKDYEYGLGFARECNVIVDLIEEFTDCRVIEFVASGDPNVSGSTFRIGFPRFDALRDELGRIKSRGDLGIRRVKETHVHNDLATTLGLEPRQLSLGRLPTSKWMTRVAAGGRPLSDEEQEELLGATAANAAQIAAKVPARVARLQRDIEVVNLDQLIASYSAALAAGHNEAWWQKFFEENVFALQLLFGGPTVIVEAQLPIGEGGNSAKGKKIADYLLRNAMTNNASLVEIKKPSTKLMKRKPYRGGVYGVQSEIGEAVTQVLDQALQLTRHETDTKSRTSDKSWASNAPRCFVVAGRASELDTADKQKSFDLYREHLSGVRLVTYDEILGQLKTLRDFLAAEAIT
ncbi:Shedu immune nuclease family protein [Aeromicrobium sp. S22]|uniref:Shedu immune nuclease family protein n=1 Tax=Aeromicrobium sp. S22 TaxID=2662029 RepID=UPI001892A5F6|nr:Shedu immune nuclease family protein [Aeromicrobium sp. S22]